jgi:hypothetical protein
MVKFEASSGTGSAGSNRQPKEAPTMTWERPGFIEIAMNAEIGGYQSDSGDDVPLGPRVPVLEAESDDTKDRATNVS